MTDAERLEEIRGKCSQVLSDEYASVFSRQMWTIVDELLTRVDALTEEVTRLRHTLAVAYDREAESDDFRTDKAILKAENARLRETLSVAYDREVESDDANAQKIAGLQATNTRLREALMPMVRVREIQRSAWKNDWDRLEATFRPGLSPFTKVELDAAAQAVEE